MNIERYPWMTRDEVQSFRKQMGWSQSQLAGACGITVDAVRKWERKSEGAIVPGYWRMVFAALKADIEPWH